MNDSIIMTPWDIFGELFGDMSRKAGEHERRECGVIMPKAGIREDGEGIVITAELPGVAPEDIEVTIDGRKLAISGKRAAACACKAADEKPACEAGKAEAAGDDGAAKAEAAKPADEDCVRYERSFILPYEIDNAAIKAENRYGILTLTLPKAKSAMRRRIEVTAA